MSNNSSSRSPKTTANDKRRLATGRTFWQEFGYRLRGWEQFWFDVAEVYPHRITYGCIGAGLVIVLGSWWLYHSTGNQRLLVGEELTRGHDAFAAVKAADDASEDFSDPVSRRSTVNEAQTKLSNFQLYARKDQEMHAGTVLAFYLDEVKQIPDRDRDCAKAMQVAQQAGSKTAEGAASGDTLTMAEVGELTCMSGRSQAISIKYVCKDEALSYLIPNRQPPVDACMFRHMAQAGQTR